MDEKGLMRLLAAGFNAHNQITDTTTDDITTFQILRESGEARDLRVFFAGWSTTVISYNRELLGFGFQHLSHSFDEADNVHLVCAVGDENGMHLALDTEDRLYVLHPLEDSTISPQLICQSTSDSPRVRYIARAGNGRIALTFKQAPNGRLCHLLEFESVQTFLRWYQDPSEDDNRPMRHHMLPGRPKQLLANVATFVLLLEDGEVYTWGDGRHSSLGRPVTGAGIPPAALPGLVDAVGGLRIAKIASGGWMTAALSEDDTLYVWGSGLPGQDRSIACMQHTSHGEVALVELPGSATPPDVLDVAVGDSHIAAVSEDGRLFMVGGNSNGQLGMDSTNSFVEDWTLVPGISGVQRVYCGPLSTFALVPVISS